MSYLYHCCLVSMYVYISQGKAQAGVTGDRGWVGSLYIQLLSFTPITNSSPIRHTRPPPPPPLPSPTPITSAHFLVLLSFSFSPFHIPVSICPSSSSSNSLCLACFSSVLLLLLLCFFLIFDLLYYFPQPSPAQIHVEKKKN